jgi:hypothetical protein
MLDLGHAIHGVVVGLAHHRTIDAEIVAEAADLGHAPSPMIRDAEIPNLPLAHEIAHGAHGLRQWRRVIFPVEIVDIDPIRAEAAQAGLRGLHDAAAREAALVGALSGRIRDLRGEHPMGAMRADRAPRDLLGPAFVVDIGGINEVHAGLTGLRDDAGRKSFVRRAAEHHRSEADRRDLKAGTAQIAVVHAKLHHRCASEDSVID